MLKFQLIPYCIPIIGTRRDCSKFWKGIPLSANTTNDNKPLLRYFVSYEHKHDRRYKEDLMGRLVANLDNAKDFRFEIWDDGEIDTGDFWHERIQEAIKECHFGLLLVSKYFLASPYIRKHELPAFVLADPKQTEGQRRAIPVALRVIDFDGNTALKGLERRQIFRHNDKAFIQKSTENGKEEFADALEAVWQKLRRIWQGWS
jgi:hypothetical protein